MKVITDTSPVNFDGVNINRDDGGVGLSDKSVMMVMNMMVMM